MVAVPEIVVIVEEKVKLKMQVCDLLLLCSIIVVVSFRSGCRSGGGWSCGVGGACGVGGGGGDNCDRHSVEEVLETILQDQVSENKHSKAGVFKYIIMEIPL